MDQKDPVRPHGTGLVLTGDVEESHGIVGIVVQPQPAKQTTSFATQLYVPLVLVQIKLHCVTLQSTGAVGVGDGAGGVGTVGVGGTGVQAFGKSS